MKWTMRDVDATPGGVCLCGMTLLPCDLDDGAQGDLGAGQLRCRAPFHT